MERIAIFGAGGHAKVVLDILLRQQKYEPAMFFSKNEGFDTFLNLPHYPQQDFGRIGCKAGVVAIGDNWVRSRVVEYILQIQPDFTFVTVIHPSAQVASEVKIGEGTVIMPNVVLNHNVTVGRHAILNTTSVIEHDCVIDDYGSVAPGAILGGGVCVGAYTAISLGAKILHNVRVGCHTVIGAGALVIEDVGDSVVSYGHPSRVVRSRVVSDRYL